MQDGGDNTLYCCRGVGPFKLVIQDDGNVVIYSNNVPIWTTHTDQVNPTLPGGEFAPTRAVIT
jgi:hypothetical protein